MKLGEKAYFYDEDGHWTTCRQTWRNSATEVTDKYHKFRFKFQCFQFFVILCEFTEKKSPFLKLFRLERNFFDQKWYSFVIMGASYSSIDRSTSFVKKRGWGGNETKFGKIWANHYLVIIFKIPFFSHHSVGSFLERKMCLENFPHKSLLYLGILVCIVGENHLIVRFQKLISHFITHITRRNSYHGSN